MTVAPPRQSTPTDQDVDARPDAQTRVPWRPDSLPEEAQLVPELRYVVLEEVVGQLATLSVAPWPDADPDGRVRFDPAKVGPVGWGQVLVRLEELHDRLYDALLGRDPRPGDTFAAQVAAEPGARLTAGEDVPLDEDLRLKDVFPGVVCDITAEARNVARLAFYAALAGVQPQEQAKANGQVTRGSKLKSKAGQVSAEPWPGPFVSTDLPKKKVRARWQLPDERLQAPEDVAQAIKDNPTALFYFLLNVGDGDSQVFLLPQPPAGSRRVMVVDSATTGKIPRLLDDLAVAEVISPAPGKGDGAGLPDPAREVCALVVATHPHDDHIRGMPELLGKYGAGAIADFWEPGFYATSGSFAEMMAAVEEHGIRHSQPTAGMTRYVDGVRITVLAPSVQLRTAYDTYGVDCNDASIVMRVDFPAVRIAAEGLEDGRQRRTDLRLPTPWRLILGGDAQTRSWSHVTSEFPQLVRGSNTALYKSLADARGRDFLAADILKVSHHASKHGINIELVERVSPQVTLISSVGGGGKYGFPHALATGAIVEALSPTARFGTAARQDADLGVHYTGGLTAGGTELGSLALMLPAKRGAPMRMWRFCEPPGKSIDLKAGRPLDPIRDTA